MKEIEKAEVSGNGQRLPPGGRKVAGGRGLAAFHSLNKPFGWWTRGIQKKLPPLTILSADIRVVWRPEIPRPRKPALAVLIRGLRADFRVV